MWLSVDYHSTIEPALQSPDLEAKSAVAGCRMFIETLQLGLYNSGIRSGVSISWHCNSLRVWVCKIKRVFILFYRGSFFTVLWFFHHLMSRNLKMVSLCISIKNMAVLYFISTIHVSLYTLKAPDNWLDNIFKTNMEQCLFSLFLAWRIASCRAVGTVHVSVSNRHKYSEGECIRPAVECIGKQSGSSTIL